MRYYFLALGTLVVVCVGCAYDGQEAFDNGAYVAPPAAMTQHPGPMVDGPGPGVMAPLHQPTPREFVMQTTQVRFADPDGMSIGWKVGNGYANNQLTVPAARYNFKQGATYQLKLTNIPGRMLTLYPTLQVLPSTPATDGYLAHSPIPIEITDEDLDQVESNNFVTKVIFLPDAKYRAFRFSSRTISSRVRIPSKKPPVRERSWRSSAWASKTWN